jgi:hypothetical protein
VPNITENRLHVSITPPHRWEKRTPSSCGKVWKKCRVALLQLRRHPVPPVVDRVEAAPQDPSVVGEPVVVEPVRAVAEPLPMSPADR